MARAPGITHWLPLPLGSLRQFLLDPLQFQREAFARFGDVFRFRIGPLLIHFLYHPDHVRRVLFEHPKNYERGWQYRFLRRVLGENLVVAEGSYWLRQRRLLQPAFHRDRLARYAQVMIEAGEQMLERWQQARAADTAIELGSEMSQVALVIAGRTLFGQEMSDEVAAIGQAFAIAAEYLQYRLNRPFTSLPAWVPLARNRGFRRAVRTLNDIVLTLIRRRRLEGRDHGDLLSMMLRARDEETGVVMTDDQLRSEALAFLLAGHETTATALTWTLISLARHRDCAQRIRAEAARVIGDRLPSATALPHLECTRRVIEEAMRLYPPIWAIPRQVVAADMINGYPIAAGSSVVLCPFITHRHPAVWDRPEEFDPERFSAEQIAQRPRGAYFPFLGGAHQCIGQEFAMLEMRLLIAQIVRRFELQLESGAVIRPRAALAIRPSGPVRVRLRSVNPSPAGIGTGNQEN